MASGGVYRPGTEPSASSARPDVAAASPLSPPRRAAGPPPNVAWARPGVERPRLATEIRWVDTFHMGARDAIGKRMRRSNGSSPARPRTRSGARQIDNFARRSHAAITEVPRQGVNPQDDALPRTTAASAFEGGPARRQLREPQRQRAHPEPPLSEFDRPRAVVVIPRVPMPEGPVYDDAETTPQPPQTKAPTTSRDTFCDVTLLGALRPRRRGAEDRFLAEHPNGDTWDLVAAQDAHDLTEPPGCAGTSSRGRTPWSAPGTATRWVEEYPGRDRAPHPLRRPDRVVRGRGGVMGLRGGSGG